LIGIISRGGWDYNGLGAVGKGASVMRSDRGYFNLLRIPRVKFWSYGLDHYGVIVLADDKRMQVLDDDRWIPGVARGESGGKSKSDNK
jgi:hypothetical protein